MTNLERSGERVVHDVQSLLADMGKLVDALKSESVETSADARARYEGSVRRAGMRMSEWQRAAAKRVGEAGDDAGKYVHAHPWTVVGVAAATGLALGAVIGIASTRQ